MFAYRIRPKPGRTLFDAPVHTRDVCEKLACREAARDAGTVLGVRPVAVV